MRWVDVDGCGQFRDIGGYRTADGFRTKWGRLYRSASLDGLSSSGADVVRGLGVRSVIDLRMPDERVSPLPWNQDDAVEAISVPSPNPAPASLREGSYDAGALYIASIEDRARSLSVVFSVLADRDRLPAVVACSGGKDRTGMMVALILDVLGVAEPFIVEDYTMSDEFMSRDPVGYAAALERVKAAGLDPEVLRTRPETMRQFLQEVRTRHGSIGAFASRSGVSDDVIAAVRANLLEPQEAHGSL